MELSHLRRRIGSTVSNWFEERQMNENESNKQELQCNRNGFDVPKAPIFISKTIVLSFQLISFDRIDMCMCIGMAHSKPF